MHANQTVQSEIIKGSIITGVFNAVINGIINWFSYEGGEKVLMSSDMISSNEHTVLSGAVPLAVSLAFVLTSITYFTSKLPGKPSYFPVVFKMALKHSIFAFGLMVIFTVLFQRFAGSVYVSSPVASVITGIIAGIVGGIVNYMTISELCNHSKRADISTD